MMTETDPAKVKPCPFCGSIGVEMHDGETYRWRIVACLECSASIEVRYCTFGDATIEELERQTFERGLETWNTRVEIAIAVTVRPIRSKPTIFIVGEDELDDLSDEARAT